MTNCALEHAGGSGLEQPSFNSSPWEKRGKWLSLCDKWKKITSPRRWKKRSYNSEKALRVTDVISKDLLGSTSIELDLPGNVVVDITLIATLPQQDEPDPLPKKREIVTDDDIIIDNLILQKDPEYWRKSIEEGLHHFRVCREETAKAQMNVRALRESVAMRQGQLAAVRASLALVESRLHDCKWEALDRDSWTRLFNLRVRPCKIDSQQLIAENLRFLDEMQYFIAWCFEF